MMDKGSRVRVKRLIGGDTVNPWLRAAIEAHEGIVMGWSTPSETLYKVDFGADLGAHWLRGDEITEVAR